MFPIWIANREPFTVRGVLGCAAEDHIRVRAAHFNYKKNVAFAAPSWLHF